jgi:sugar lactone lactonase YvrE
VWKVNADGGTPYQFKNAKFYPWCSLTWSPGSNILYLREGEWTYHVLHPTTEEERSIIESDIDEPIQRINYARYSQDGERVAVYMSQESSYGLWIISLKDSSKILIKEGFFSPLGWSPDGKWIYVLDSTSEAKFEVLMISVENKKVKKVFSNPFEFVETGEPEIFQSSMTSDGKHFVYPCTKAQADVWVVDFDPDIK